MGESALRVSKYNVIMNYGTLTLRHFNCVSLVEVFNL